MITTCFNADAPWKMRFRIPVTYGLEIAAQSPSRGLVLSNRSGVYQLCGWDVTTGQLTQVTATPEGVYQRGTLSPNGRFLYYLEDQKGNETGHLVRIPFTGGTPEDITPTFPLYGSIAFALSRSGNCLGFLTYNQGGFALYRMSVAPDDSLGASKKLFQSEHLTMSLSLSFNGEIITVNTANESDTMHFRVSAFDGESGELLNQVSDERASIEGVKFSPLPRDTRLLATSDVSGVKRPFIWDIRSGERIDLALDELEGEVEPVDWSPDGKRLLLRHFSAARQRLYLYDLDQRQARPLHHPDGLSLYEYFSPDGNIYAHLESATRPMQLLCLDGETGKQKRVVFPTDDVPPSRPWKSIAYPSSDGQMVQGWLALPEGSEPFPTILEMHGGPDAVMTECFSPRAQCWLDAGFAFLSINYRGSLTFGRAFQEQIRGQLGKWEVEDMVAARQWLIHQRIARPDQVFLTGWSYGGYLTLMGLGKRADLWAGGMAGATFGDFFIAYEDESEQLKAYDRGLMGGTPQEKPEAYHESSAMTYLEHIQAPLLIIQGHNDTRCPPRSIQVYEKRARELGKNIEVIWFDAGHGTHDTNEQISHQERMLHFAWKIVSESRT
ncbi:prolyl oligopeptidase family serine peptidase [Ktedonospora formicarum]|uniref:Acyl-peptide hydrolase n=1 Tax=Ktedonospora formicarum TaxID=2778364 RepID=A0A8J3HWP8_9CHLR|nr:prolyl oligopeptidase family serine peptidase [Ktedonospora formicarum]GHO42003.1 peptide hydrolase [Ktedonospora formicarum]